MIKFPRTERLLGTRVRERMERDIVVGKQFLGEYMLDTRLAASPKQSRYAQLQAFVRGRPLKRDDLSDRRIAEQFRELILRHDALLANGFASVDFMSGIGFMSGSLRNIFLLENVRVSVIDVMLIDVVPELAQKVAMWRQQAIIASYQT